MKVSAVSKKCTGSFSIARLTLSFERYSLRKSQGWALAGRGVGVYLNRSRRHLLRAHSCEKTSRRGSTPPGAARLPGSARCQGGRSQSLPQSGPRRGLKRPSHTPAACRRCLLRAGPRGHHTRSPRLPGRRAPHGLRTSHGRLPAARGPSLLGKDRGSRGDRHSLCLLTTGRSATRLSFSCFP